MKSLRGGNSAFFSNGVLYSDNSGGCLRTTLLRSHGVQEPISPKTERVFALGHISETFFDLDPEADRETEVSMPLSPEVMFVGHMDFSTSKCIYELKSVTSKNVHKQVFDKGSFKMDNLVQLATYMFATEVMQGKLIYTSFTDVMDYSTLETLAMEGLFELASSSIKQRRVFGVEFDTNGDVFVDGEWTGIDVAGIVEFQACGERVLRKNIVWPDPPRPHKIGGQSACVFCKVSPVCTAFAKNPDMKTEEFVDSARLIYSEVSNESF